MLVLFSIFHAIHRYLIYILHSKVKVRMCVYLGSVTGCMSQEFLSVSNVHPTNVGLSALEKINLLQHYHLLGLTELRIYLRSNY